MSPQASQRARQVKLAKRFGLLTVVLCLLGISLVACSSSDSPVAVGSSDNSGISGFKTPNANLWTPTPTFPPFTVGAWPSNYSPLLNDTVTIYVLCRTQQDMNNPPGVPSSPVTVHVQAGAPINKSADGTTDASGLAAVPLPFSLPQSAAGKPIEIAVNASYGGKSYLAKTYFTAAVTTQPTPTPAPTSTP